MPTFPTETVTLAGSGIVFVNSYGSGVTSAYRAAIIAAENFLQSQFVDSVTLNLSFDLQGMDPTKFAALNTYYPVYVSYAALRNALTAHATTADDRAAAAALPAFDPSGGSLWQVSIGEARILGLAPPGQSNDDSIVLNSNLAWGAYGNDAVQALIHEISEGAMGRVGLLGHNNAWAPMDLFRFTASGLRDYTGGEDGVYTYFSPDGRSPDLARPYHNSLDFFGNFDGQDLADWDLYTVSGDSFGAGGPGAGDSVSATDLRILDVLGWTPKGAAPVVVDDYRNSLFDTSHPLGQVAVGGFATGILEIAGDRDWFAVTLVAGTVYTIDLQGAPSGKGTLADPFLRLHDGTGALLLQNDDHGSSQDSEVVFTPTQTGTYYIEAGSSGDALTGSYRVAVSANSHVDDYANALNDTTHPIGTVAPGGSATGAIEVAGDRDWFSVTLSAGFQYKIDLSGSASGAGTLSDPYLRLHDGSGALIGQNDDASASTTDSEIVFTPTTSGVFYIEAGAYADLGSGTYRVRVTAQPVPDDFANSLTDTQFPVGALSAGGSLAGVINYVGDRDWFKVQLTAGILYTVDLQGTSTAHGTLVDPYLWVHDSAGAILFQNDDAGPSNLDAHLSFTVAQTGTYYLEAGGAGDQLTGSYRLALTAAPLITDDFANSLTDSTHPFGVIAPGGTVHGTLEIQGDRDWIAISLSAGSNYTIKISGASSGGGTLTDPYLRLHDTFGTLLAQNDDLATGVNPDSQLTFSPTTTGAYYIEVGGHADGLTGTYTVSVSSPGTVGQLHQGTPALDVLNGGSGDDTFIGGGGNDLIFGGGGSDVAQYSGSWQDYAWWINSDGSWTVQDERQGSPDGTDSLTGIGTIVFSDRIVALTTFSHSDIQFLQNAYVSVTRSPIPPSLLANSETWAAWSGQVQAGGDRALLTLLKGWADATTTIANLSYQFFTGGTPSAPGLNFLVTSDGPNPNNLNSAYYQNFGAVNRYINFAVNLGANGEGEAAFSRNYGNLSLGDALSKAYTIIFGGPPTASHVQVLLNSLVPNGQGGMYTRAEYFADVAHDSLTGIATKAAMVGWLMSAAASADVGAYAQASDALLLALAQGAQMHVNLVGVYGAPGFTYVDHFVG